MNDPNIYSCNVEEILVYQKPKHHRKAIHPNSITLDGTNLIIIIYLHDNVHNARYYLVTPLNHSIIKSEHRKRT